MKIQYAWFAAGVGVMGVAMLLGLGSRHEGEPSESESTRRRDEELR